MTLEPGARLGPYEILALLGSGGMGVVYKARDARLGRAVAIKLLPHTRTADTHERQRFVQEARTASTLDHVNICTIHEINETADGQLYLVMAFYEGETVAHRIARAPLDWEQASRIAGEVAAGLADAHAAGIVHRDIKPANLFVTRSGGVKILDFGLAKLSGDTLMTQTGTISGTLAYMSPEQVQGHPLDGRTDIWSLGVVLYEMLTGRRPFAGDNLLALSHSITHDHPPTLALWRPDLPAAADAILARALAKMPADRYQEIAEMKSDLEAMVITDRTQSLPLDVLPRSGPLTAGDHPRSSSVSGRPRIPTSIAVLPFADMSAERDQDYFCEGMAEELISALTAVDGLHVAARTSSFLFKGGGADVGEIGRRLRVGAILSGSVRKAGSRLRITAQLVKTADGYHLWSERFDRDMDDVFAVQDEIARSVVGQLRVQLQDSGALPLVKRHTTNLDAYHWFLRGRHYRFTLYDLRGALDCFGKAVEHDASYALAHAAIADCLNILGLYAVLSPETAAVRAKAAVERALRHDAVLPEAFGALAQATFLFDRDAKQAEDAFAQAIRLKPSGVEIYCWFAYFLATLGRAHEGLAHLQHAATADPLSAYVSGYTATTLYVARRYDAATERCADSLQLQPNFALALNTLALCDLACGRFTDAVAHATTLSSISHRASHGLALLGVTLAAAGQREEAASVLSELNARAQSAYVSPVNLAWLSAALGLWDKAFSELDRALHEGSATLHSLTFPHFDSLRADSRWPDVERRLALPVTRHAPSNQEP